MGLDVRLVVVAVVAAVPSAPVRLDVGLLIVVGAVVRAAMAVRLYLGLIVFGAVIGSTMTMRLDIGLLVIVAGMPTVTLAVSFELIHLGLPPAGGPYAKTYGHDVRACRNLPTGFRECKKRDEMPRCLLRG
jgi:hypothetical protein